MLKPIRSRGAVFIAGPWLPWDFVQRTAGGAAVVVFLPGGVQAEAAAFGRMAGCLLDRGGAMRVPGEGDRMASWSAPERQAEGRVSARVARRI